MAIESGVVADIAGYLPAAAVAERGHRQEARYKLRSSLRRVTELKRLRSCGLPLGDMVVRVKGDVHHFSGMSTCGSGWVCPVCAAKIRYHRADEVSRAVVSALDQGMCALFVTRTIPHSAEDSLGVTLGLLAEGRRYVTNQKVVKAVRTAAGYVGGIASKEITYGFNGWHPHTHDIEFCEREVTLEHFAALSSVYYEYLNKFYAKHGFAGLSRSYGVRVEYIRLGSTALAQYVAKLQEGAAIRLHTAQELARVDLKQGRAGSLMPFDIACDFFQTGDMALLDMWHEYERETVGKSIIRFTKGLRARLLPDETEQTDEELAALEVGGSDVVRFAGWYYRKLARVPGLEGKVLTALDTGGFAALVELLTVYRLDDQAGYWQVEHERNDHEE
ncbi:MAG TPA: hypothetical protein VFT53_02660 [Candidatus Saccharimonadales bacterium]|nr:hypothetical protein [Candidatus Saccharimonadales bacterium]